MYLMAAYMTQAYLQVVAPSALAYTAETATFTKGTATAQNSPSYDGEAVTSWSVSPSLPTGLSFNTSTGVITGTPTALATQAVYTVTAANAGGSTTKGLTFTVVDVAPSSLSYGGIPYAFTRLLAISAKTPSVSGGPVVSYSVSPALPAGLSLNAATGVLSGTPTAVASAANYTVTATNTGGSATFSFSLAVSDATPLINVPPAVYSGEKVPLTLSRATLSSIPKVQNHPVFGEQAQWQRVQAVYVNPAIPYGDTDRIVGVRFRGANDMTGRFKATADSGDTYSMARLFIRDAQGNRLRVDREDIENVSALDFTIS